MITSTNSADDLTQVVAEEQIVGDTVIGSAGAGAPVAAKKPVVGKGKRGAFSAFFSRNNMALWAIMLPAMIYIIIFHYLPMFGLIIAFKDYDAYLGIWNSPWASMGGFEHFVYFVTLPDFWTLIKNTLILSTISIAVGVVLPISFALIVNEIRGNTYKKFVQTVSYAPYFISTVVVVSMMFIFGNLENGIFNKIITAFGGQKTAFMERADLFAAEYVISGVWQALGWASIIFVGTLANVDMNQHEAAVIDGANRMQRIIHVNLPTIVPILTIQLIMNVGSILSVGFEKVYLMQTSGNITASRIISTYVYEVSMGGATVPQFSYATAIGLFNSTISIVLLAITNMICKRVSETSLW